MNLYELISTADGYQEFQRQLSHLSFTSSEHLPQRKFKSEEINSIFQEVFEDPNDRTVLCLCDILDIDLFDSLDVNQIYLIVTFAAAVESAELVKYLHKFGSLLFEILSSKSKYVVYERVMRIVSLMVNKTSVELQRLIQAVGIERGDKVYFEEFELLFFQLFSEMDQTQEFLRLYYSQNNRVSSKIVKLKSVQHKQGHKSAYGLNNSVTNQCALI